MLSEGVNKQKNKNKNRSRELMLKRFPDPMWMSRY